MLNDKIFRDMKTSKFAQVCDMTDTCHLSSSEAETGSSYIWVQYGLCVHRCCLKQTDSNTECKKALDGFIASIVFRRKTAATKLPHVTGPFHSLMSYVNILVDKCPWLMSISLWSYQFPKNRHYVYLYSFLFPPESSTQLGMWVYTQQLLWVKKL